MTKNEFLDAMGGIDGKLIESVLDVERVGNGDISIEEPMVLTANKRPSVFKYVIYGAAGVALIFGIAVFVRSFNGITTLPNESDQSSDSSDISDSSVSSDDSSRSESYDHSSVPDVIESPLNNTRLQYDNLSDYDLIFENDELTCEAVLTVQPTDGNLPGCKLYANETGLVIASSDASLNKHYFWIDRDGNELDHLAFDYYNMGSVIPNRDYPEGGAFTVSLEDGGYAVRFYKNGKLQKSARLPLALRSDFTADKTKYLYTDYEMNKLSLFDLETETDVASRTVEDFGLDAPWTMQLVNVITPKLAVVTFIYVDEPHGFSGDEEVRTFLISLPTLDVIQRLPDGAKLTALDDENFVMTKRDSREIVRAVLENGELIEKERISSISQSSDAAQYFNSGNILLSPNKKVMLIREWEGPDLRCRAFSTDTMEMLWEAGLRGEDWLPTGFHTSAVITDDAEFYVLGMSTAGIEDKPLYRISAKK